MPNCRMLCWFFTQSHHVIWLWRWSIINHWIPFSRKPGSFDISASLSIYLLATWMSTNMCLAAQDIVLKSLISCYLPNNNIVYVQIIQPLNWVRVFTLVFAVCVALWYYFIRDYWLGTKKDSKYHIGYYRDSPNEDPVFLASNDGTECKLNVISDNILAAVHHNLQQDRPKTKGKLVRFPPINVSYSCR